jgi:deazaflavin-dependent oxidoreductase (nitroreductase family)
MSEEITGALPDFSQMPEEWWRAVQSQAVEQVRKTGTTVGVPAAGPVIVVEMIGVKTGIPRQVPLLRIEHEGSYLIAASKGGAPREPKWAGNLRANPDVKVQDGAVVRGYIAREVTGGERETWWERAVVAQPSMKDYKASTGRLIALFVLDPA